MDTILDPLAQLLYLFAKRYYKKTEDAVWKDAMFYILERPAMTLSELCQSDTGRATAWYHALSAIPATEMSLGSLGYCGILLSAIDDVIHIESADEEKEAGGSH